MTLRRIFWGGIGVALSILAALPALAQGTIQQAGPLTPGHTLEAITNGVVMDSGPAGGGGVGVGLSELLLTARGTGTPPYVGMGSGPYGTNDCDYDAPITNPTGYHFLCLSANALGSGGLIAYGSGGGATPGGLFFNINGTLYGFPGPGNGDVSGPVTTVVGDLAVWNSTVGTLLKDVTASAMLDQQFGSTPGSIICRSSSAWTILGAGTSGNVLQTVGASACPQWTDPGRASFRKINSGASDTATAADSTVAWNSMMLSTKTSGLFECNSGESGKNLWFVDEIGGATYGAAEYAITLAPNGSDTINNATSYVLNSNNKASHIQCDGAGNWVVE